MYIPMLSPTPAPSLFMVDDMTILVVGRDTDAEMGESDDSYGESKSTMDILASVFFAVAATWLLIALAYASLVLLFLRIRARGDLDRIYEADFGRIYLCGTRCYISLGWLLRRYIQHIHPHPQYPDGGLKRLMTRKERREAMEKLLTGSAAPNSGETQPAPSASSNMATPLPSSGVDEEMQQDGDGSTEGPVCSICLGEYDEDDDLISSKTCSHRFHKECVLDWLQRPNTTECPCCRVPMTNEEAVWNVVETMRDQAKQPKPKARTRRLLGKLASSTSSSSLSCDEHIEEDACPTAVAPGSSMPDLEALRNMSSCVSVSSAETAES